MSLYLIVTLLSCIVVTLADISGTDPPVGSCICADGSSINVRDSACGTVIGSISSGDCYTYAGNKETCLLDGTSYEYFDLNYEGGSGWVAGDFLVTGSDSDCQAPADDCNGSPNIVSREEWGARPPTSVTPIAQPIPKVFIHHTDTDPCYTQAECEAIVRSIQDYHMDSNGWNDIGYNFLVGEDGNAYEGRGWDVQGAHVSDYNSESLGISVIGNFMTSLPNAAALNAVNQLIDCGLDMAKLDGAYTLHGHRDGGCTSCPGDALYAEIQTWSNYGGTLPGGCSVWDGVSNDHGYD